MLTLVTSLVLLNREGCDRRMGCLEKDHQTAIRENGENYGHEWNWDGNTSAEGGPSTAPRELGYFRMGVASDHRLYY